MNRHAESAQIESGEVAAVSVRRTGERAIKARKTRIDDLTAFAPVLKLRVEQENS